MTDKLVIDCATGEITREPLSQGEIAAREEEAARVEHESVRRERIVELRDKASLTPQERDEALRLLLGGA